MKAAKSSTISKSFMYLIRIPFNSTLSRKLSSVESIPRILIVRLNGFELIWNDHGLGDDLLELNHLDPEIIFLVEVPDLIETIVAGSDNNLCAGCLYLLGFYPSGLQSSFFELPPHWNKTAPAPAAVIVDGVGRHIAKIFGDVLHNCPALCPQAAISGNIAGVLVCHRFTKHLVRIDFDPAVSKVFIKK